MFSGEIILEKNLFWWQLHVGSRNGNARYRSVSELHSVFSSGHSADHVVTCLTRDSYNTHTFIQQLMAVLSLLARTPSPEPVDKDFYSEFGSKNTGEWSFLHVTSYLGIILQASPKLYWLKTLLRDIYASIISYLIFLSKLPGFNYLNMPYVNRIVKCMSQSCTSEVSDGLLRSPWTYVVRNLQKSMLVMQEGLQQRPAIQTKLFQYCL